MFSKFSEKKGRDNLNHHENFIQKHGGSLTAASEYFNIPQEDWLDISTGINPEGWPVPEIPSSVWQRLPEQDTSNNGLESVALNYYLNNVNGEGGDLNADIKSLPTIKNVLPCSGSQQAIRLLPNLYNEAQKHAKQGEVIFTEAKVWVTSGSYTEHGQAWEEQGHRVGKVACDRISQLLAQQPVDVLILVNPDNPSGHRWSREQLLKWWSILQRRGGWLIVDEAFMDMTESQSLVPYVERGGLFVLRSVGKFFGLAGIRLGFMFASEKAITYAKRMLGPWSLNYPAQYIGQRALQDQQWITRQKQQLKEQAARLENLLNKYIPYPNTGTELFRTVYFNDARRVFNELARLGILTRYLASTTKTQEAIRFGLPSNTEDNWQRIEHALSLVMFKQ